jgi:two-component system, chemotaxis family, chemotaxis protein CheY
MGFNWLRGVGAAAAVTSQGGAARGLCGAGARGRRLQHHGRINRNLLKQIGFADIDDAADGAAALSKMHAKRYGLVISDWKMEPMTGFDLLRQVRADPKLGETPFIMVTAESKTENVIAARKAGVNNYIVKPSGAQTLKAKIEAVFARKNGETVGA